MSLQLTYLKFKIYFSYIKFGLGLIFFSSNLKGFNFIFENFKKYQY